MKKIKAKVKLFRDKQNKKNHAKKSARKKIAQQRTEALR